MTSDTPIDREQLIKDIFDFLAPQTHLQIEIVDDLILVVRHGDNSPISIDLNWPKEVVVCLSVFARYYPTEDVESYVRCFFEFLSSEVLISSHYSGNYEHKRVLETINSNGSKSYLGTGGMSLGVFLFWRKKKISIFLEEAAIDRKVAEEGCAAIIAKCKGVGF